MICIDSSYFSAAVVLEDGIVIRAAPILKYMMGWSTGEVYKYCNKKKWHYKKL